MKTLYLGPKVSMSLPFVLIQLRKLAAILIVTLFSLSAFSQELIFQNPTLESGTSGANGAIYRFRSVTANGNVDALLKVISRSDSRVKLKDPDFSNRQVLLNWTTTEEKNVSHFVIEKSNNGHDYNEAGLLFTEGNSEVLKSYQYKDGVSGQDPVLYYRLRIVDLDGRETFSAVRMIRQESMGKNQLELLTYPNPIVNELRITIPEGWQNKQVTYELFDGSGRLLKQVVNKNASQTEILNVQSVQSGTIILRAFTNEDKLVQRIIKS